MPEFNPYEAPRADITPVGRPEEPAGFWRDGSDLVARIGATYPDRCIKCNEPAEGRRFRRTLRWHPSAYYFLVLFNILIYAIVAVAVSKRAYVEAGICPTHRRRRRVAILAGWVMSLSGIALIVAGTVIVDNPGPLGAIVIVLGAFVLLGGLIYGVIGSQFLVPRKINKQFVWLKKVHPGFLMGLPDWTT